MSMMAAAVRNGWEGPLVPQIYEQQEELNDRDFLRWKKKLCSCSERRPLL
jgi:hypothetical protein